MTASATMTVASAAKTTILCIGDMHVKLDNLGAVSNMAAFCIQECARSGCDTVAVLGDLLHYHKKVMVQPMLAVLRFLRDLLDSRLGLKVIVLVGNHDMLSNQTYLDEEGHWMGALKHWVECARSPERRLWVVDGPEIIGVGSSAVACCPYVPPGKLVASLDERVGRTAWTSCELVLGHQEIRGAKMGSVVSREGDEWDASWPLLVSGHIHDSQWVADNMYYTGSSMQHSVAERESKTVALVSLKCANARNGVLEIATQAFASAGVLRRTVGDLLVADKRDEILRLLKRMKSEGGIVPTLRLSVGSSEKEAAVRKTRAFRDVQKYARIIFDAAAIVVDDIVGVVATNDGVSRVTLSVWERKVMDSLGPDAQKVFRELLLESSS